MSPGQGGGESPDTLSVPQFPQCPSQSLMAGKGAEGGAWGGGRGQRVGVAAGRGPPSPAPCPAPRRKQCIELEQQFDFLKDLVAAVPDMQGEGDEPHGEGERGPRRWAPPRGDTPPWHPWVLPETSECSSSRPSGDPVNRWVPPQALGCCLLIPGCPPNSWVLPKTPARSQQTLGCSSQTHRCLSSTPGCRHLHPWVLLLDFRVLPRIPGCPPQIHGCCLLTPGCPPCTLGTPPPSPRVFPETPGCPPWTPRCSH